MLKRNKTTASSTALYRHPVLGEVSIITSVRARRVSIRVKPTAQVSLTAPRGVVESEALNFLERKIEWVQEAIQRTQARIKESRIDPLFSTREHILKFDPDDVTVIKTKVAGGIIHIRYPATLHYSDSAVQQVAKKGIDAALRIEAARYLPSRVEQISCNTGLKYGKVSVRNVRTRWGSCSSRNDISLNIQLMRLPDHLIDYVILHELCHTVHKNHGPKFHALLDKLSGGREKPLRKELKAHTTTF